MDIFTGFKLRLLKIRASWDELSISKKSTLSLMVLALLVFPSAYLLSQSGINLYGRASERDTITNPNPSPTNSPPSTTPYNFQVRVNQDLVEAYWFAPQVGSISDYRIEYRLANTQAWQIYEDGVSTARYIHVYLYDGVQSTLNVEARVRAILSDGSITDPSNVVAFTEGPIPAAKPLAPVNLRISTDPGIVRANWTSPYDYRGIVIVDFKPEYKIEGSSEWIVFQDGVSHLNYLKVNADTNRTPALAIEVRIRAVARSGAESDPSAITRFTLGQGAAIRMTSTPKELFSKVSSPAPICHTGIKQLRARDECGSAKHRFGSVICWDNSRFEIGTSRSCYADTQLKSWAANKCANRRYCEPVPTLAYPTPTPAFQ